MEVVHMNSIVIYASHSGNTSKVAEAIAGGLQTRGTVKVFQVERAPTLIPPGTDLLVVGGPTQDQGMTQPVVQYCDRMEPAGLSGIATAAFDTRRRWPRWLSGSAGAGIAARLHHVGARVLVPAQSFFVEGSASDKDGKTPELVSGELERAAAWAISVAHTLALTKSADG
jgi:flavodoxin